MTDGGTVWSRSVKDVRFLNAGSDLTGLMLVYRQTEGDPERLEHTGASGLAGNELPGPVLHDVCGWVHVSNCNQAAVASDERR